MVHQLPHVLWSVRQNKNRAPRSALRSGRGRFVPVPYGKGCCRALPTIKGSARADGPDSLTVWVSAKALLTPVQPEEGAGYLRSTIAGSDPADTHVDRRREHQVSQVHGRCINVQLYINSWRVNVKRHDPIICSFQDYWQLLLEFPQKSVNKYFHRPPCLW